MRVDNFKLYRNERSRFQGQPYLSCNIPFYVNPTDTLRTCFYTYTYSVCIPRDFDVTNATVDRNMLLRFKSKNKGNLFIFSSFLVKHGAVYAAYRALSPFFQRSLISGLVISNNSMNIDSKFINIADSRSIIKTGFWEQIRRSVWKN